MDNATAARVAALIDALANSGETVAVAESLTGGLVLSTLVNPAGASRVVVGGAMVYSTDVKASVLGVDAGLLAERGAVDAAVAVQMAAKVRAKFGSTVGLATTGVAGPDPQDGIAVGTVFVAVASDRGDSVEEHHFEGTRDEIRWATVDAALAILENSLRTEYNARYLG
ncbi:MAG: CinA family protein [Microbacteriaceae bacterium]|nr:CinA family protein [Microbacteriaceae bacterium]